MAKEQKTASELEAMILARVNDPRVRVFVGPDPMGWHATPTVSGEADINLVFKVQQIAERFRTQYDLKEE